MVSNAIDPTARIVISLLVGASACRWSAEGLLRAATGRLVSPAAIVAFSAPPAGRRCSTVSALSDVTRFDTLIVGAGSAGAILATRLSEDPERSVGLIEAGPDYLSLADLPDRIRTRGQGARIYGGVPMQSHEWAYVARATALQPEMRLPRGRVVGGSSSINGVVLLHALRSDLDNWAAMGNADWSYDACIPFYRALERDYDYGAAEGHGTTGPIP